ncbi:MAG: hypothetical protein HY298_15330 [Verrucomicrobia bacterium]|nr:hypothetical protein [Verrucomicrobiota bacterium]
MLRIPTTSTLNNLKPGATKAQPDKPDKQQGMKAQFRKAIPAMLAMFTLNAAAVTRYVELNSPSPTPPYTNWPTAATNIQDAVDVAGAGDEIVVTNGVYVSGGRAVYGAMTNRVAIDKPLLVRSLNGPLVTFITGQPSPGINQYSEGAIRCAYVGTNAILSGFTLTNGYTRNVYFPNTERCGGGVWCESSGVVTNCTLINNSADLFGGGAYSGILKNCALIGNWAGWGGGAYWATLSNCTLSGNWVLVDGGGAYYGALTDCTLSSNSYATFGGGACYVTLNGCTLTGNSAMAGGGSYGSWLNNCTLTGNSAGDGGGARYSNLTNCTLIGNSAGDGGGASSCTLDKCTLTGNSARNGGGASSGTLNNCTLSGNLAFDCGGGVSVGSSLVAQLNNCTLTGNSASNGGGACSGTLVNCTLVGNSAFSAGGAAGSSIYNSIVYYNYATNNPNCNEYSSLTYSCTTPLPPGLGNIADEPLFEDTNVWSNLRLQSNSPCINAGKNGYVTTNTELDGNPRIAAGTADMGAYEFQTPRSVLSYAWAQHHGLPTDGSVDFTDSDNDGMNNWREWKADTIPTNALSVLRMVTATNTAFGLNVTWQSVSTRSYWLERATNLGNAPPFQSIATNIAGAAGTKTYTDASATNRGPYFYRVGVQ